MDSSLFKLILKTKCGVVVRVDLRQALEVSLVVGLNCLRVCQLNLRQQWVWLVVVLH